jgi:hypothetical protein
MRATCRYVDLTLADVIRRAGPRAAHALGSSTTLGAVLVANLLKMLLIRLLRRIARRR